MANGQMPETQPRKPLSSTTRRTITLCLTFNLKKSINQSIQQLFGNSHSFYTSLTRALLGNCYEMQTSQNFEIMKQTAILMRISSWKTTPIDILNIKKKMNLYFKKFKTKGVATTPVAGITKGLGGLTFQNYPTKNYFCWNLSLYLI